MSLTAIREQVKQILAGVGGIGVVHDYERLATDWTKFLDRFKDPDGRINGWTITRDKTPRRIHSQGSGMSRTHRLIIRGFYGLQDGQASEIAFQDLVEAIDAVFADNDNLNGACFTCTPTEDAPEGISGIQVEIVEPRMFGSVLCHYAELHLYVQELI